MRELYLTSDVPLYSTSDVAYVGDLNHGLSTQQSEVLATDPPRRKILLSKPLWMIYNKLLVNVLINFDMQMSNSSIFYSIVLYH